MLHEGPKTMMRLGCLLALGGAVVLCALDPAPWLGPIALGSVVAGLVLIVEARWRRAWPTGDRG